MLCMYIYIYIHTYYVGYLFKVFWRRQMGLIGRGLVIGFRCLLSGLFFYYAHLKCFYSSVGLEKHTFVVGETGVSRHNGGQNKTPQGVSGGLQLGTHDCRERLISRTAMV